MFCNFGSKQVYPLFCNRSPLQYPWKRSPSLAGVNAGGRDCRTPGMTGMNLISTTPPRRTLPKILFLPSETNQNLNLRSTTSWIKKTMMTTMTFCRKFFFLLFSTLELYPFDLIAICVNAIPFCCRSILKKPSKPANRIPSGRSSASSAKQHYLGKARYLPGKTTLIYM